jgi:hypothetical protein
MEREKEIEGKERLQNLFGERRGERDTEIDERHFWDGWEEGASYIVFARGEVGEFFVI